MDSKESFIEIIPEETDSLKLWSSKFGGTPYMLKDAPYPSSEEGDQLYFLAQINFAEMPAYAPFPDKGILQFFINDDAQYGQNQEAPFNQQNFKVIFHEQVIEDEKALKTDFSDIREFLDLPVYPENTFGMSFELANEIVPVSDNRFNKLLTPDFFDQFGEAKWEIYETYTEQVSAEGHKIGGYAHFAQEDPRSDDTPLVLLFQMDTDVEIESMWGDMGTANFFISEEDLKNRDFSNVMYHWDCH